MNPMRRLPGTNTIAKRASLLGAVALLFATSVAANECPSPSPTTTTTTAGQGEDCKGTDVECDVGLTCLHYYGIAGPAIEFATCEIPCTKDAQCPDDQTCAVIADGPGQVCTGGGAACPSDESSYVSHDAVACETIRIRCTADTVPFNNECGCGCMAADGGNVLR